MADVTSQNIVGYAKGNLCNGATLATAQFQKVGGEGFSLFNIKPSTYGTSLYQVDSFGFPQTSYLWTDCGGPDWDTPDVWVNFDTNEFVEDVPFNDGDALFISGSATTDTIQTSGQVGEKEVKVMLCNGATLAGNPFPVAVKVNDLIASTYGTSLYKVDSFGFPQTSYLWTDCGGPDWDTPDVWVDEDNNIVENVKVAAGEGLLVAATSDEQFLVIPAPELDK